MTQITTTQRVCEHLEKYIYDHVWNEPYSEYRTYIRPTLLTSEPVVGYFRGIYGNIPLPVESEFSIPRYFSVYAVPISWFMDLRFHATRWMTLAEFDTKNLIDLQMFTDQGKMLWRKNIYICQSPHNECMLLLVEDKMFKSLSSNGDPKKVIFGKYFDSDLVADNEVNGLQISARDYKNPISLIKRFRSTYLFYDGNLISGDVKNEDLLSGHYLEYVYDEDIDGTVDVDCMIPDFRYLDKTGTSERVLIHIPKSINDRRIMITPNTCDIYLINKDNPLQSAHLYQAGRGEHFHQITHNDFSIDMSMIREVAAENGFDNYVIRMFVRRNYANSRTAIRDANYINLLYLHSDEEIVKHLLNKHEDQVEFWDARVLEQGLYAAAMLRRRGTQPKPNEQCDLCKFADTCEDYKNTETVCPAFNRTGMDGYIDILGYHHVLSLIGKHISHFKIVDDPGDRKVIVVRAPLALTDVEDTEYVPLVYINGSKVPQDKVSIVHGYENNWPCVEELQFTDSKKFGTNVIADNYATPVEIKIDADLRKGDLVSIDLIDSCTDGYRTFLLKKNSGPLVITTKTVDKWQIFKVIKNPASYETNPVTKRKVQTIDPFVTYTDWIDHVSFNKDTKELKVEAVDVDTEFVVIERSVCISATESFEIEKNTCGPLLENLWSEGLPSFGSLDAYLNGKKLIENLDYTANGTLETSGNFDLDYLTEKNTRFFLQSVSYLKQSNILELFVSMMNRLSVERDYLGGKIISWTNQDIFWFDELSSLTIDGKVCTDIDHSFGKITVTGEHRNGAPYEIRTSVSARVRSLLEEYKREEDVEKMLRLREYFNKRDSRKPYMTIVHHSHKVFSVYLEKLIKDYLDGKFAIGDAMSIVKQIPLYEQWKNRDVGYGFNSKDFKFVDIYPTYNRLSVTREQYVKITALARMLMPKDNIKHKDDANV